MILLTCVFVSNGCEKEENNKRPEWSKFTALKNGEKWEASAIAHIETDSKDTAIIQIANYYHDGNMSEALIIKNIPTQIGKSILFSNDDDIRPKTSYYLLSGIDVINARYKVDGSHNNFIEIQDVSISNKEMSGIFQLTFIRDHQQFRDTITFSKGSFRIKIIDSFN